MSKIVEKASQVVESFEHRKQQEVEVIILAGGNSRIPKLKSLLQSEFSKKKILNVPDADTQIAVAKGAALYAYSSDPIRRYIAYDIFLRHTPANLGKEKRQFLWKRGSDTRQRRKTVVNQIDSSSQTEIVFVNEQGTEMTELFKPKFSKPLNNKTLLKTVFEIDTNGYLRYTSTPLHDVYGEPMEDREIIRRYLFATIPPER
jgi:hypothetical protein